MREILFRGKRTDNGEWVEGCYSKGFRDPNTAQLEDLIYMFSGKPGEWEFDYAVVIPETVGQYTGLTDKNGTKIFEGDIVKVKERWITATGVVKFRNVYNGGWVIGENETDNHGCSLCIRNDVEVIGNIHDNPELLKGGAE